MSGAFWALMPIEACPTCDGRGTVDVTDATRAGATFVEICPRCRGVGTVVRHLVDHPETKR